MYDHLNGSLAEKNPTSVVVDVNGLGFLVHIPLSTYGVLPSLGEPVRLLVQLIVREDDLSLYGFQTRGERDLFRLLISVSGIGPKIAMTALSGIPIDQLKRAIADGDLAVLTSISGVGRKTAERIVIELREKLSIERKSAGLAGLPGDAAAPAAEDALQALVSLGYRKPDAKAALEKVLKNSDAQKYSVERLIRDALRNV
jgi:Holliday junction DNA helicase RuvA